MSNCAILPRFLRYMEKDFKQKPCITLSGRTIGSEMFRSVNEYFCKKEINWENSVGVCTDETASKTCYHLGVVPKIKVTHKEMLFTHFVIRLEHLAVKKPPTDLKNVFEVGR